MIIYQLNILYTLLYIEILKFKIEKNIKKYRNNDEIVQLCARIIAQEKQLFKPNKGFSYINRVFSFKKKHNYT